MTLEDVAAAAGVSPKTVSRVMNNEPNVRSATREKVLKAARSLGYRPNPAARSLASSKSYTIAHLHNNPDQDYTSRANSGIYRVCRDHNYLLFIEPLEDEIPNLEDRVEAVVSTSQVDGVILSPPLTDYAPLIDLMIQKNVPIVAISPAEQRQTIPSVSINERAAAKVMTEHLIRLGHKSIGFISGPPSHGSAAARKDGFADAITEAGLSLADCPQDVGDFSFRSGLEAGERMLSGGKRPSAIFAANDVMAAGAMTAAFKSGMSVPDDLSIAGFDASYVGSILWPPLTTIRQPIGRMAEQAARWLITGDLFEDGTPKRMVFDFELVERPSTAKT